MQGEDVLQTGKAVAKSFALHVGLLGAELACRKRYLHSATCTRIQEILWSNGLIAIKSKLMINYNKEAAGETLMSFFGF